MSPSTSPLAGRLRTPLCSVLGTEFPIVQAPIGSATTPALVAAVSNAGGLGVHAMSWREPKKVREVIHQTQALTERPFAVNLGLEWSQEERLDVCLEEGVPIVSLFWGDPSPHAERIHSAGALLIQTVGTAEEARKVVDQGADVVVAQGWEAGGHVWGEVASLPLIPRVVDAVQPVPVIAAGGIADGRGVAAALALGAAGVWLGTRFLASEEAAVDASYKEQVLRAAEADTVYSELFDGGWAGAPHRTIENSTVRAWRDAGRPASGHRPGEGEQVAMLPNGQPVERYSDVIPLLGMTGELEALALYAGQAAGLVNDVKPAAEIVRDLLHETLAAIRRLREDVS